MPRSPARLFDARTARGARSACCSRASRATSRATVTGLGSSCRSARIDVAVSAPMFQALCLAQLSLMATEDERPRKSGDPDRASRGAGGALRAVRVSIDGSGAGRVGGGPGRAWAARAREPGLRAGARLLAGITDPSPWYEIECRIVLARAALRLNGLTAARDLLATAAAIVRRSPDVGVLEVWLEGARAQVDLALDTTAVTDWSLTAAEVRVLGYLPSHLSFREIADRLYVSPNTVKSHARGIYRKLGVSSRGNAVDRARSAGLVPAGGEEPR